MWRSSGAAILVAAALAISAGCHRRPPGEAPDPDADIELQIVNHHWLDVTIYVAHDGVRTRIGMVTATSSQSFTLQARTLGRSHELFLIAEAIGSRAAVRTETLSVLPGQRIEWSLETDLRRSSVGVY